MELAQAVTHTGQKFVHVTCTRNLYKTLVQNLNLYITYIKSFIQPRIYKLVSGIFKLLIISCIIISKQDKLLLKILKITFKF